MSKTFSKVYNEFKNEDKLEFSLRETSIEGVVRDICNGTSELGIIVITDVQKKMWQHLLNMRNLEFHEMYKRKPYVRVGVNSSLYNKECINVEELKAHTQIRFGEKLNSELNYNLEMEMLGIKDIDKVIYVNDMTTFKNVMRNTDAYSIGQIIEDDELKDYGIKSISIAKCNMHFQVGWIKRKKETISKEGNKTA
ncbi:MAG: hypothetical protein ACRCW0_07075 [Clostridium sp.]